MELRVSAQERAMPPSVYETDPDDKEISDDDDDRNHKHRRREDARSQSLEDDLTEQIFTKPYRRGNKPYRNGHLSGETASQSNETWKKYSFNPLEKDISMKYDQKRPNISQFSRGPSDLNHKNRVNVIQPFHTDPSAFRGRGRDSSLRSQSQTQSQRDPRFNTVDIASQIVQQGAVPHSLFAGRGLTNVSKSRGSSWGPFGLVSGIANGGLDMIHPLGLQGTFGPAMNMGIARQRCRDFEEQGFCLRGDMCPMEHGMNRIVVEDVQSLSQFNLPVSLASTNLSIPPAGTGPSPATTSATNTFSSNKLSHGKNTKHGISDNGLESSGTFIDSSAAADFYDPDQPLWGNDSHSPAVPQSVKNDSLLGPNLSDGSDNELFETTGGTPVGSLSTRSSIHGKIKITSTKKRNEIGENLISKTTPSKFVHNETIETPVISKNEKRNSSDLSQKMQGGNGRMIRKPSQKAQRTLFVNGIPQQNNKRESLLSHFKKFGEVIDVHIPLNSERAFVQFSKREEAEAALMAPDAVMGNRFIKLWWANRDNIPDIETSGHSMALPSVLPFVNKRKDDSRLTLHNDVNASAPVSASDHSKVVVATGAKVNPPLQKMESLEVLKEEIRKKQEMLDQKRNDFRRQLDKLAKQSTGVKGEVAPEQIAKKQKLGILSNFTKVATLSSSDGDTIIPQSHDEVAANSKKFVDSSGPQSSKTTLALESSSLKPLAIPSAHVGSPVVSNRFKLDNRPTAFKIVPPLPDGLADVAVLKEHFFPYGGDISKVQLDEVDPTESNVDHKTSKPSARIYFTNRHAAEKAFSNCKNWKGHNLQFQWLKPNNNSVKNKETPSPNSKTNSDVVETSNTISRKLLTSGDKDDKSEKMEIAKEYIEMQPDDGNNSKIN